MKRIGCMLLCALWLFVLPCAPIALAQGNETVLYGDAEGDGLINMKDVLALRRYLADLPVSVDLLAADATGDDAVNMKDVLLLRKYMAGLVDKIPGKKTTGTALLKKESLYDDTGALTEYIEYSYDGEGRVVRLTDRGAAGDLYYSYAYTYDEAGREISRLCSDSEGVYLQIDTTYTAVGQKEQVTRTDTQGAVLAKTVYTYDENGHCIKEAYTDGDGADEGYTAFFYNNAGQLVKEETYGAENDFYGSVFYAYNANGRCETIERYGADGSLVGIEAFSYSVGGRMSEHSYLSDEGALETRILFTYNGQNALVGEICYEADGKTVLWQKEYTYITV